MIKGKAVLSRKGIIAIAVACFVLLCSIGTAISDALAPSGSKALTQSEIPDPALSFTVDVDVWNNEEDESLVVLISGTDDTGSSVSEKYVAVPYTKYRTELKPGSYTMSLASNAPTKGMRLFKAEDRKIEFAGITDEHVVLDVALDEEATAKAIALEEQAEKDRIAAAEKEAEEKRIAEEQAEAERKAAEERAAQEKAAQEAAAAQSAVSPKVSETAPKTSGSSESTVYIAASGKGSKYHRSPSCSRMKDTITLTESQAKNSGYGPCAKCA